MNAYDPTAGLNLPDTAEIKGAQEKPDPMERTRHLYQLSLRYRELSKQALEAAKDAANEANSTGIPFGKVAGYAGASSASSFTKMKGRVDK